MNNMPVYNNNNNNIYIYIHIYIYIYIYIYNFITSNVLLPEHCLLHET